MLLAQREALRGQREALDRLEQRSRAHTERIGRIFTEVEHVKKQVLSTGQGSKLASALRLDKVLVYEVARLRQQSKALTARVARQLGFSRRVLSKVTNRGAAIRHTKVLDRLDRLARSDRPVIVGPWTGEVGFELAYWIPFVRWALGHAAVDPARVTVISRGGAQPWYDGLAQRYVDVTDLATAEEVREGTAANRKQRVVGAFDRTLVTRSRALGTSSGALIHPSMMYAMFYPYLRRDASLASVTRYARFRRLDPPPLDPGIPDLPPDYVAVRFYFNDCFPDTPDNREFVSSTLASLAEQQHVVVLHAGTGLDDHTDALGFNYHGRVHVVDAARSVRSNLAVQSAIIARARAFVGTYGGFSYLAPLYGVDTVAFHSTQDYHRAHLQLAQHAASSVGGGALIPLDVRHVSLLQHVLGGWAVGRHAGV